MFQLTKKEFDRLLLRNATSKKGRGGRRKLPVVFTEHGSIMAANVLRTKRAVQMSVFVVRAFIRMRSMLTVNKELARKLTELETELKKRLDTHERAIVGILQRIMQLIDPPPEPEPDTHCEPERSEGEAISLHQILPRGSIRDSSRSLNDESLRLR